MTKLLYFLATFAHSGLSVFGIRGSYEQPAYRVVQILAPDIELRDYAARVAVESVVGSAGEGEAFGRLFRYITGANTTHRLIAMTAPVEETSQRIAMTVPVEMSAGRATMRFFLPAAVAAQGAPVPTEAGVHIVSLPEARLGVVRYSGSATAEARARQEARLRDALSAAKLEAQGSAIAFSYDPPFTIPALRRNEIALAVSR